MYADSNTDGRRALQRIVNDLPAMVAYWDAKLRCRFANRAYEKWFGVTAEAMLGRDMKEFLGPLYELNRPFIEGVLRGEEQEFEREIPDPHGGPPRYSQAHYIPDIVDGTVRGFSVLVADITRRRQAEQALNEMERKVHASERLAAVATLAAGTAHELNNPLAAVLANVELGLEQLDRAGDREDLYAVLVEARDAALRASGILRNMATLARGEVTTRERVDVHAAIETSLQLTRPAFRYKARVVREDRDTGPVLANAAQLIQVLVNLLLNASQALPDTADARNEIRVISRRDGGQIVVEVHDNGCGIPAELHARIFEPFFTTKAIGGGMGLGLSIALGIVRSFGGTLAVHSEPGAGSVFSLSLPAAPAIEPARAVPSPAPELVTPSPIRRRILIVDDEKMITRTLQRALAADLDVVAVESGPAALAVLAASDAAIDVVLCDLMMPGMTGQEVYEAALELRPHLRHRFVIMTGGAFTPRGQEFLATFDGPIIKKPFEISDLRDTIVATLATP
ncbi:MAG TPA: ATP-binding protein [Kofleriaceae bacterium]|nr:ATP-binding protein [Kofleriaceae bacterium]